MPHRDDMFDRCIALLMLKLMPITDGLQPR
jgi:hypothetical protein